MSLHTLFQKQLPEYWRCSNGFNYRRCYSNLHFNNYYSGYFKKIVKSYFIDLSFKDMITDSEHFAVKYPPAVRHLFVCLTLFWFALLLFFWESRTSSAWAYTVLCAFFLLSLFLLYCTWKWRVIVSGQKVIIIRPFHLKREFYLNQLKGYSRYRGGGKIIDMRGKVVCIENIFVQPPVLYNYFLKHKKILSPDM